MAFPTAVPSKNVFPGLYKLKTGLNLYNIGETGDPTTHAVAGTVLLVFEAWETGGPTAGTIQIVRVLHGERTYTMLFATEHLLAMIDRVVNDHQE